MVLAAAAAALVCSAQLMRPPTCTTGRVDTTTCRQVCDSAESRQTALVARARNANRRLRCRAAPLLRLAQVRRAPLCACAAELFPAERRAELSAAAAAPTGAAVASWTASRANQIKQTQFAKSVSKPPNLDATCSPRGKRRKAKSNQLEDAAANFCEEEQQQHKKQRRQRRVSSPNKPPHTCKSQDKQQPREEEEEEEARKLGADTELRRQVRDISGQQVARRHLLCRRRRTII